MGRKCESFQAAGYQRAVVGTLFGAEEGAGLRISYGLQERGE